VAADISDDGVHLLSINPHSLPPFDLSLRRHRGLRHKHTGISKVVDDALPAGSHAMHHMRGQAYRVPHQGDQDVLRSDRAVTQDSRESFRPTLDRVERRAKVSLTLPSEALSP
jgi:hypothetical protein